MGSEDRRSTQMFLSVVRSSSFELYVLSLGDARACIQKARPKMELSSPSTRPAMRKPRHRSPN